MIEFFTNVLNGIISHKDEILVFLSSAEFAVITAMISNLVKSRKTVSANTLSNTALSNTISKQIEFVNDGITKIEEFIQNTTNRVNSIIQTVETFQEQLNAINHNIALLNEADTVIIYKLDSILEVQSLAYSTLKDTSVRSAIINTLASAKHIETKYVTDIASQLEEMKNSVLTKTQEVERTLAQAIEKTENMITVAKDTSAIDKRAKTVISRG